MVPWLLAPDPDLENRCLQVASPGTTTLKPFCDKVSLQSYTSLMSSLVLQEATNNGQSQALPRETRESEGALSRKHALTQ